MLSRPPWRLAVVALAALASILGASGCGGSTPRTQTTATAPVPNRTGNGAVPPHTATSVPTDEVLAIAEVGRFLGSCPSRGPFGLALSLDAIQAGDAVSYRIGTQPERHRQVDPGGVLRIALPASAIRLRQGDRVLATPTVVLRIQQPSEPHTILLGARLRLARTRGGSPRCLLIGTDITSRVNFNDGGPPR